MVIFLYGADSYRSKQKLDEIVDHYKAAKKSGLNLRYVDGGQADFQDFYDMFKSVSMFAEKKLVVVKNAFTKKDFQEEFAKELKTLESFADVVVVYEAEAPDARLKLFKDLKKLCKFQEFAPLEGAQLKSWAQKELQGLGATINNDALDLLLTSAGNDLWRLSQEIQKLAYFKRGVVINREAVAGMVRPNLETDIFKTVDALAQKNKPLALSLLQKHLDAGEVPLYLLSMIAWQFKNLLVVKELAEQRMMYDSIVKKSGLHPFVVKKNYFACSKFSLEDLKRIYRALYTADTDIKTGRAEAETALDLFVAKI